MPVSESAYRPPFLMGNGYLQSILPTLIRRIATDHFGRERIETSDDDFLDLDWSKVGGSRLVILSHGLEGHSRRPYVAGVARMANEAGWDALAWNFRSCGGETNRQLRLYHSGATDDLDRVIQHALKQGYEDIHLVGFSMGGNLSLLHAGCEGAGLHPAVRSVTGFSVPCDLTGGAVELAKPENRVFMRKFLTDLRGKVEDKARMFPGKISAAGFDEIRTFREFDDRYTAPIHGFRDALDYWEKSSCGPVLDNIRIPALLVNAQNDPFLSDSCYPWDIARNSDYLTLEVPESGGHVGFIQLNLSNRYWMEERVIRFIRQVTEEEEVAAGAV